MKSALVVGAGSWGTALAAILGERGLDVQLWGRDVALMGEIEATRCNARYAPRVQLPAAVRATADWEGLRPVDLVVLVVPSKFLREAAERVAGLPWGGTILAAVSCTKGIELESGRRMSELIAAALPTVPQAVLTGPNHSEEVACKLATAAVVACADEKLARALQGCFTLPWFRSYTTDDVIGAEWGGAMKNPYAIAAGIAKGLELGDNAVAALVTRALAEMVRLGTAMGGRPETFQGLSGVGDLVATCYSEHSRNHRVGLALGRGQALESILASTSMVAEGVPNTLSLYRVAQEHGVRTPLLEQVHAILYEAKPPPLAMRDLLARDPRPESD